jgi:ribosome-associated toxin RatA of RatAB toxin-antitoxin module
LYYIQAYHVDFPFPFVDRDFVIKTQFSQDIQNKSVLVQCTALPDKLPQSVRSFHVTDMHNSWRFTPLEDGQTEVEFVGNYDLGMPYFMFNKAVPGTLSDLLPHLEELFNKDKYQHREFAFVKQP